MGAAGSIGDARCDLGRAVSGDARRVFDRKGEAIEVASDLLEVVDDDVFVAQELSRCILRNDALNHRRDPVNLF